MLVFDPHMITFYCIDVIHCIMPSVQKKSCIFDFYRAMHYSAKHGLAIACRLSVRLSVTLVDHDHMG